MAPRSLSASTRHPSEQRSGDDQGLVLRQAAGPAAFTQPHRITAIVHRRLTDLSRLSRGFPRATLLTRINSARYIRP